jgi:hypothetical protein
MPQTEHKKKKSWPTDLKIANVQLPPKQNK